MGLNRCSALAMATLAFGLAGPAAGQESLDAGKSGPQLFASDCALCHKSPQGLAKSGGIFGLSGFLKQHYTASQETANIIAKYLESLPNGSEPSKRTGPAKRTAKGDEKEKKLGASKPGDAKSSAKPADSKTTEPKASEPKALEPKASEAKPAEAKSEPKAENKTEPKSETKPEAKPDKPEKSD